MPASQARRLCPTAIVIPPDFTAYREKSREVWALVRAQARPAMQSMGLDEAYADLTGVEKPLRVLRELIDEVKQADRHPDLGRRRAQSRLVAKCCSDLGKPAGLRGHGPRGGVHPLRDRADAPAARASARRPPSGWPSSATRPSPSSRRPTRRSSPRASATASARYLKARATLPRRLAGRDRVRRGQVGLDRAHLRRRTSPSHEELETILRTLVHASSARAWQSKGRQGRTVAIKVRLADWTTVTRARTLDGADQRHRAGHRHRARAPARLRAAAAGAAARRPPRGLRRPRARQAAARAGRRRSGQLRRFAASSSSGAWPSLRRDSRASGCVRRPSSSSTPTTRLRSSSLRVAASPAAIAAISASSAALGLARVERGERRARAPGRPRAAGARPGRRRRTSRRRSPAARSAASRSPRRRSSARAGPRRRRGPARAPARGAGSASPPAATSASASEGSSPSRKRSTCAGGSAPMNSSTTLPSLNALTAGIDWIRKACGEPRVGVGVDLDELDLAVALVDGLLDHGRRAERHGPHHSAQKSTTTGCS